MENGKLKRIRFNHDGTVDMEVETEDGKRLLAKQCTLHVEQDTSKEEGWVSWTFEN